MTCLFQISELPEVITSEDTVTPASGEDAMTIAWRYQNLRPVTSVIGSQNVAATLGHHFDLACSMDSQTIDKADITKWSGPGKSDRTIRKYSVLELNMCISCSHL